MYILAIETTGPVGSVALMMSGTKVPANCGANVENKPNGGNDAGTFVPGIIGNNGIVGTRVSTVTMSHLKNLMPMVKELFDEQGVKSDDIAAVAASCGPGSFTGIRIGVSTARALAQAWGVPCISVPTLETFKEKCLKEDGEHGQPVCVIFNARRGQVYAACYGENGETLIKPGPYMLSDVLDEVEKLGVSPVFYGDGVDAYFGSEEFAERVAGYQAAPEEERYQTADMTARFALEKLGRGETVEYGELTPDYMRESEAEQRLKDGSLEKMRKEKLKRLMKMAGKE